MIAAPVLDGQTWGVFGLARSGLATLGFLSRSGASAVAWDDREDARRAAAVEYADVRIEDLNRIPLEGLAGLIVSPGVPLNTHPLAQRSREASVEVLGDIELFARARPNLPPHKVVGITGTNGKSTTTALIHHLLEQAGVPARLGGNIGLPVLAQEPLPEGGVYVLELSSFQMDLTRTLDCDVACITNVTPDHLDRYDGFDAYIASKERLFAMQSPDHVAVVATDNEVTRAMADRIGSQVMRVGRAAVTPDAQAAYPALQGPHNAENAAVAIATVRALGLTDAQIEAGLRSFGGLPHRMEVVGTVDDVRYVNDSKATNPDSTAPALSAYPAIHWIAGGLRKGDDLDACLPHLGSVKAAYLIGEAAETFAGILRNRVPVTLSGTLEQAVADAAAAAKPGDTVLLSPACASFDQFKDYEARGAAFRAAVQRLAGGE